MNVEFSGWIHTKVPQVLTDATVKQLKSSDEPTVNPVFDKLISVDHLAVKGPDTFLIIWLVNTNKELQ